MIRKLQTIIWAVCVFGLVTVTGALGAEHEAHHPAAEEEAAATATKVQPDAAAQAMPGMMGMMGQGAGMMNMMGQKGGGMTNMPCLDPSAPSSRLHMMGGMLSGRMTMEPGMMKRMMDREFFLDRAGQLGLSAEQVTRLRAIRSACRKDNIRTGAEARIARLELDDLLGRDDWSLDEAEKLIRKMQKLEGDMLFRHLQAAAEAREVLTPEQLETVRSGPGRQALDKLFQ